MKHWPCSSIRLALLGLLLLIIAVYWPGLHGGFIFDDYPIFVENPIYATAHWDARAWLNLWTWSQDNIGRPLAMASYALNYIAGGSIFGFKLVNVLLHAFNTLLAYRLAFRLFTLAHKDARLAPAFALTCAALWALHPLLVSTVLYVVQRMEMLGFTFTLLALLAYLNARQESSIRMAALWGAASALAVGIGYTAKETVVLMPVYVLAVEWLLPGLQPATSHAASLRKKFVAIAIAAGIVAMCFVLPQYLDHTQFPGRRFGPWDRMLTQLPILAMYLRYALVPSPLQYRFYYDDYPVSHGLFSPVQTLYGLFAVLIVAGIAVAASRRRPLLTLGLVWFFIAHSLTSGPFNLELAFEHRNYPALFGLVIALVDGVLWITSALHPRLRPILGMTLAIAFAALTFMQAAMWGKPLLLDQELARLAPSSPRAQYSFAQRQLETFGAAPGTPLFDGLIHQLERTADLPLSSPLPDQALLVTAATMGMPIPAAWWNRFHHKLETSPIDPQLIRSVQGVASAAMEGLPLPTAELHRTYRILMARDPLNPMWASQYIDLLAGPLHEPAQAGQQLTQLLKLHPNDQALRLRLRSHYLDRNWPELAKMVQ